MTSVKAPSTPISVVILTLNEEANIERCLQNVHGWSDDIHIIDSYSEDKTVELSKRFTENIHLVKNTNMAYLRNYALEKINQKYSWILFLDADEYLTEELKGDITSVLNSDPSFAAFYIKRRFIFLDRWLKHGGLYSKILRMFQHASVYYIEDGEGFEKPVIDGKVGLLKSDIIHADRRPFSRWIDKHNIYSDNAARKYFAGKQDIHYSGEIEGGFKTSFKQNIWIKIPLFLQPFLMFTLMYFLRGGFLDGVEGLQFHFFQSFWYRSLIAVKYSEYKHRFG